MVTGKRPFDADSLQGICAAFSLRRRCRPRMRILRCLRPLMGVVAAAWQKNRPRVTPPPKLSRKISIRWRATKSFRKRRRKPTAMVCARAALFFALHDDYSAKGPLRSSRHLGSGATSRVEKARDNVIGRIVAIKTFLNGFREASSSTFRREAQIIGQLSNPCIVQLYDVGIDEQGTPFLVMEYVAGKTRKIISVRPL